MAVAAVAVAAMTGSSSRGSSSHGCSNRGCSSHGSEPWQCHHHTPCSSTPPGTVHAPSHVPHLTSPHAPHLMYLTSPHLTLAHLTSPHPGSPHSYPPHPTSPHTHPSSHALNSCLIGCPASFPATGHQRAPPPPRPPSAATMCHAYPLLLCLHLFLNPTLTALLTPGP